MQTGNYRGRSIDIKSHSEPVNISLNEENVKPKGKSPLNFNFIRRSFKQQKPTVDLPVQPQDPISNHPTLAEQITGIFKAMRKVTTSKYMQLTHNYETSEIASHSAALLFTGCTRQATLYQVRRSQQILYRTSNILSYAAL